MMVVIQPQTSGYHRLPYTLHELHNVEKHVPKECLVTFGTPGAPASVEEVLTHMSAVSIVHLACHGEEGDESALSTAFVLEGGQKLKVSRIMELPMPNASLAFLSACHTARGSEDHPDEAINLATSLLFAGFRGSVAAMW
jgi:CHAT domain-containing protein